MKILIVANGVVRAGVSRVLSLLSQEWQKDHDVYLSLFKNAEPSYPVGGSYVLKGIPFRGLVFSQVYHLYKVLKSQEFDKIYGFSEDANYPLSIAAKLAGVEDKIVLSVHNPIQKLSDKVKARVRKYYPMAGRVLTVSEGVKAGLVNLGLSPEKISFVPNPIDMSIVAREKEQNAPISFNRKYTNIISVGRLHSHKGFDLLIRAFSMTQNENLRLWIVGGGEEKQNLEALINDKKLQERVALLGEQENPFSFLAQSDFYVMSSRLEGWPLVLMEAMAVGLPVISFDCPNGPDEIIENKVSGLIVPCGDVDQLAKEIDMLSQQPELREELGQQALKRIAHFDVERIAKLWLEV